MLDSAISACNTADPVILADIDLTVSQLEKDVADAKEFYARLHGEASITPEKGLVTSVIPDWAPKLVRRQGIAGAVVEKAGSRAYVKRRPEDVSPFLAYVQKQMDAAEPLLFRVGFGPLKNVNACGGMQNPDWAEYLALVQLTRLMYALAGAYPHGIKVQIVPDDLRTCSANLCPEIYAAQYIRGLQKLVRSVGLENMVAIENGQARIYARYDVPSYRAAAERALSTWREAEPEAFAARWAITLENAGKNLRCANDRTPDEIEAAAWRYMTAHRAEMLSGLWSPGDAFPLRYANHPNSYQLYTIGFKKTKLPWQISLPVGLLNGAAANQTGTFG